MQWHAATSPLIGGFLFTSESLTHTSLREGAPCQHLFPPHRFSWFNFLTLKTAFIFLLHWFFFFFFYLTACHLQPMLFFCLSFFSITLATLVAARHGRIQTAIGWSARPPDRREQGERIGSPMPGNLPDNGMWTPNNIHKYSDEAKWGCPGEVCGAIAVSGMCKEKQRQRCCVGMLLGRGKDLILICHVARVRDALVFFVCVEPISSFWMEKTNILLGPRSDAHGLIEALLHLNNQHTLQFPLKVCVRATINMAVASHILVAKRYPCGSWTNTKRFSAR